MPSFKALRPVLYAFAVALLILGVTANRIFSGAREAPEVQFATLKGELVRMSDLRGKVVLVNFWATSCAPCVREMPQLAEWHKRYAASGLETVAVAMDYDPPNLVADFTRRFALPFRVAMDARGEIAQRFGGVSAVPSTFLVDRQGRIILKRLGELDFDALKPVLESALKAPPA